MTEKLLVLLQNKKDKLREILALTQQQSELLDKQQFDAFQESLEERQRVMNEVDQLDREMALEQVALEDLSELQELLKQIIELDQANGTRLNADLANVKLKMQELHGNKVVQQAYAPFKPQQKHGYFIDRIK